MAHQLFKDDTLHPEYKSFIKPKIAVILANLGGPDSIMAVRPFLFNLFYDRAIIDLPNPWRFLLAKYISFTRLGKSQEIYLQIGGLSPILPNTLNQAKSLKDALLEDYHLVVLPMMRYWHPRASEVVSILEEFAPEKIVLLPLYPHFSTTTTQSTLEEWWRVAKDWQDKTLVLDNHFNDPDFIGAHQESILPILDEARIYGDPIILFSAHGLPQKTIDKGDPYQKQIEASVGAIMRVFDGVDHSVCYQSKVGPLKWLEPSLDNQLKNAANQKRPVVVVPISFVCEHSETLVELDIYYKNLAKNLNIPFYGRVPALAEHPLYIKCLAKAVRNLIGSAKK